MSINLDKTVNLLTELNSGSSGQGVSELKSRFMTVKMIAVIGILCTWCQFADKPSVCYPLYSGGQTSDQRKKLGGTGRPRPKPSPIHNPFASR